MEFLVGANTLVDRTGVLLAVGANYILINEIQTDDITACDFYNIKFVVSTITVKKSASQLWEALCEAEANDWAKYNIRLT